MSTDQPPQAAAEEATAHLLSRTFIEIRGLAAPLLEDQSPEALIKRRDRIHELADICHNLPGYLSPEQRHGLVDGLRYMWQTCSDRKRQWIRYCWDNFGYDYGWLAGSDARPERQPASGG